MHAYIWERYAHYPSTHPVWAVIYCINVVSDFPCMLKRDFPCMLRAHLCIDAPKWTFLVCLPCNIYTTIAFPASINSHLYVQERKSSFTYDYVRDEESGLRDLPSIAEGHYEFDTVNEEPYWEPASVEDELRKQLHNITLSEENLT